ncbi:MAG: KTSC domain-containing protein [Armatimonadota bacterium]|nr:KTSC domain-containing protein [Armatimonadota bacterium]
MQLTTVESSMIHAVGYDAEKRVLEVVFNSGRTYCYEGVEPEIYEGLMAAESKGQYMRDYIIDMYPDHQLGRRRR